MLEAIVKKIIESQSIEEVQQSFQEITGPQRIVVLQSVLKTIHTNPTDFSINFAIFNLHLLITESLSPEITQQQRVTNIVLISELFSTITHSSDVDLPPDFSNLSQALLTADLDPEERVNTLYALTLTAVAEKSLDTHLPIISSLIEQLTSSLPTQSSMVEKLFSCLRILKTHNHLPRASIVCIERLLELECVQSSSDMLLSAINMFAFIAQRGNLQALKPHSIALIFQHLNFSALDESTLCGLLDCIHLLSFSQHYILQNDINAILGPICTRIRQIGLSSENMPAFVRNLGLLSFQLRISPDVIKDLPIDVIEHPESLSWQNIGMIFKGWRALLYAGGLPKTISSEHITVLLTQRRDYTPDTDILIDLLEDVTQLANHDSFSAIQLDEYLYATMEQLQTQTCAGETKKTILWCLTQLANQGFIHQPLEERHLRWCLDFQLDKQDISDVLSSLTAFVDANLITVEEPITFLKPLLTQLQGTPLRQVEIMELVENIAQASHLKILRNDITYEAIEPFIEDFLSKLTLQQFRLMAGFLSHLADITETGVLTRGWKMYKIHTIIEKYGIAQQNVNAKMLAELVQSLGLITAAIPRWIYITPTTLHTLLEKFRTLSPDSNEIVMLLQGLSLLILFRPNQYTLQPDFFTWLDTYKQSIDSQAHRLQIIWNSMYLGHGVTNVDVQALAAMKYVATESSLLLHEAFKSLSQFNNLTGGKRVEGQFVDLYFTDALKNKYVILFNDPGFEKHTVVRSRARAYDTHLQSKGYHVFRFQPNENHAAIKIAVLEKVEHIATQTIPKMDLATITNQLMTQSMWPVEVYYQTNNQRYMFWYLGEKRAFKLQARPNPHESQTLQFHGTIISNTGITEEYRQLVISYIRNTSFTDDDTEAFDFLDFLLRHNNFLLNEPDSTAVLFYATSSGKFALFKYLTSRLQLKLNSPSYLTHPLITTCANLSKNPGVYRPYFDYIFDHYSQWSTDKSPLITTIRLKEPTIFQSFLHESVINKTDLWGVTPLMHALKVAESESDHFVESLLVHIDIIDFSARDMHGQNVFVYALKNPLALGYFDKLIQHAREKCGYTLENAGLVNDESPLFFAVKHADIRTVQYLINLGANLQSVDQQGHNAIYFACVHNRLDIAELLYEQGCVLTQLDQQGLSVFHACLEMPSLHNVVAWLIEKNPRFIANEEKNNEGHTALLYAVFQRFYWAIDLLISSGADTKAANNTGMTLGHYLAAQNQYTLLDALLNAKKIDFFAKNLQGECLLDLAVQSFDNMETVRVCLAYVRRNKVYFDLTTCRFVRALLMYLANMPEEGTSFRDGQGQTILHIACLLPENQVILENLMVKFKFSVNIRNTHRETPLCTMVRNGLTEQTMVFIDTYSPKLHNLDQKQSSLLHLICETNNLILANRYVSRLASDILKKRGDDGQTPLSLAFLYKNHALINVLWDALNTTQQRLAFRSFELNQQTFRMEYVRARGYQVEEILADTMPDTLPLEVDSTISIEDIKQKTSILVEDDAPIIEMPRLSAGEILATISTTRHMVTLRQVKRLQLDNLDYILELTPYAERFLECAFTTPHYGVMTQVLRFPCVHKDLDISPEKAKRWLDNAFATGKYTIARLALTLTALRRVVHESDNLLYDAVLNQSPDLVMLLLHVYSEHDTTPELRRAFILACTQGNLEIIDCFLSCMVIRNRAHEGNLEILNIAIEQDNIELMNRLLSLPNVRQALSLSLLFQATNRNNIDIFTTLLSVDELKLQLRAELNEGKCDILAHLMSLSCDEMIAQLMSLPEIAAFAAQNLAYQEYLMQRQALMPQMEFGDMCADDIGQSMCIIYPLTYFAPIQCYPKLPYLEEIYEASINGNLIRIQQLLQDFVFPPFFVPELYDILYLAVSSHQHKVVAYLLQNEVLLSYTLTRTNHLPAVAIARKDTAMLKLLIQQDVIRQHLTDNYNYPLRFAVKLDALPMVDILLNDPNVAQNADALNNYILRYAAKQGSMAMVQRISMIDVVRRRAHVFQHAPFRQAYANGHFEVCRLLMINPQVFQWVMLQPSKYERLLHAFVEQKLNPFPNIATIRGERRLYELIACYCLAHTSGQFTNAILTLVQQEPIRKRVHLGLTSLFASQNELLSLAEKATLNGHTETQHVQKLIDFLRSLPSVQNVLWANSAQQSSVRQATLADYIIPKRQQLKFFPLAAPSLTEVEPASATLRDSVAVAVAPGK